MHYLLQVVHIICGLIRTGDTEMKLILTDILCKLATCQSNEHKNNVDSNFTEAFTNLLQDSNDIVRNKLFGTLRSYIQNKYLDSTVTNIVRENDSLQETWMCVRSGKYDIRSKESIASVAKYTHKCLESKNIENNTMKVQELKEANLDDFYFDSGGSEMLVETETKEPPSKRGRPNTHETDLIIRSLEENVSLLNKQDVYTPDQLVRIQNACEKLINKCVLKK